MKMVMEEEDRFLIEGDPVVGTNTIAYTIPMTDSIPVYTRQYPHFPMQEKDISDLENFGIIVPSSSPYNSSLLVVPKKASSKGNKRWRVVVDFRKLNEKTVDDRFPIPRITDIIDRLGGARYFSVFDLASGFHQIPMAPEDRQKTALTTPEGHSEYVHMPFGLKNAPATFH